MRKTLPNEPAVIYFFQPFKREVFAVVIDNIRRSLEHCSRHVIILYYHAGIENYIGQPEFLRRVDFRINSGGWDFYESIT